MTRREAGTPMTETPLDVERLAKALYRALGWSEARYNPKPGADVTYDPIPQGIVSGDADNPAWTDLTAAIAREYAALAQPSPEPDHSRDTNPRPGETLYLAQPTPEPDHGSATHLHHDIKSLRATAAEQAIRHSDASGRSFDHWEGQVYAYDEILARLANTEADHD